MSIVTGTAGKLWILRALLVLILASLLAWRVGDLLADDDVATQSGFNRSAWEVEYASYLNDGIRSDPVLVPCALNELKEYGDDELLRELTHAGDLFLARVRVSCDRMGAEAIATSAYEYVLTGREINCTQRRAASLTDEDLARVISAQKRIDRLARDCGGRRVPQ